MYPFMPSQPGHSSAPTASIVRVERLSSDADERLYEALTGLLHRAYLQQVRMGLQPLAGRQDVAITRRRCQSGETYVALLGEERELAGMILFQEIEEAAMPEWFLRPEVAHFSLFAVDPPHQRHGIGGRLLQRVERRCGEIEKTELALSMAEPDTALSDYYHRRGYRFVQHWQWPYTNYRSAILSRAL